ncbi:MAG: hypothetical protein IAG13_10465 [Deltaproteobacteria bacterium]|nr:hypothetical protein [Nannocystaceae bacterium]
MARHLALSLGAALLVVACDKKDGDADGKSDADKTAADEAAKKAADEETKKKAAADEEAKKKAAADEEAKKKAATDEAAKKAAEDEAKKKAEEEAKKPVSLSDIQIKAAGVFGSSGAMQITAKAKFNEVLNNGTFVHVKGLCKKDSRLIADVVWASGTDYTKQLHQYAIGETADLQATLFGQGVATAMSPCQLDFRLGSGAGGVSVPLRVACFDGSTTKEGPCEPPIVAAAMSGASLPVEIFDLAVKGDTGFGGAPGIQIDDLVQINVPLDDTSRLIVKSTCTVGTTKFVDLQQANMFAGPYKYESGEALLRPMRMYYNPAFGFTEPPKLCDVGFSVWKNKPGSWSEYDQTVVKRACFKDDKVAEGPCDPAAPPVPAAAPISAESVTIDNVKVELAAPYGGAPGQLNVKLQADVTVKIPIDQASNIDAHVTCKVGSAERVEKTWISGVEYYYLEPGETTRVTAQGFSSEALAATPKSCEVSFTGGKRFGGTPADKPVELGKWCLKKDKLKAGKC